jgi:hypothetical protein
VSSRGYEKFKYFLECYFVPSMNYDDVKDLTHDFVEAENNDTVKKLSSELNEIICTSNWHEVQKFVLTYGMRSYDVNKTKGLVEQILNGLK